jgi:hypothetical protein
MAGTPVFGTGGFLGTDLGTNWEWAAGDGNTSQQKAEAIDGGGDTYKQTSFDPHSTGSETYHYNGTVGTYGGTAGALNGLEPESRSRGSGSSPVLKPKGSSGMASTVPPLLYGA